MKKILLVILFLSGCGIQGNSVTFNVPPDALTQLQTAGVTQIILNVHPDGVAIDLSPLTTTVTIDPVNNTVSFVDISNGATLTSDISATYPDPAWLNFTYTLHYNSGMFQPNVAYMCHYVADSGYIGLDNIGYAEVVCR